MQGETLKKVGFRYIFIGTTRACEVDIKISRRSAEYVL